MSPHPPCADMPCLLQKAGRRHAEEPAIITPEDSLSFAELEARVDQRAITFLARGVQAGDWIALRTRATVAGVIDLLAVLRSGACLLPVNPAIPETPLGTLLQEQGIRWLVREPGRPLQPSVRIDRDVTTSASPPAAMALRHRFQAHTPCTGILTSGSTGRPKLAVHSYANHVLSAAGSAALIPLWPGDRYLLSLPTYHVGGLAIVFRCLLGGAALVLDGRAENAGFLLHMGVTHVSMVETQLHRLLKQGNPASSTLRCLLLGGGPVRASLLEQARRQGLPCWTSYGLTEMSSQVIAQPPEGPARILPHRECRLDADGEILVRGGTLFLGYRDSGGILPSTDGEGWFHTRDLGRWEDGRFQVVGRLDNQFISGGENIQPEAIEHLLHTHPDILRAVVVPRQDAEFGHRPVAFIQSNAELDDHALRTWLREQLKPFMVPTTFLPMPPTGDLKIQRRELIRLANTPHPRER
ncbi:o-succinylbenzoate--CoA ligase [Ectothiorhodospira lacustris]|uniref:o-succinylbenzoate--CoA ligase n=1 Tax=Ectothiorhodospira lacustris TaxID=2899127 RepID=UPI001EE87DE0|nr:o-succinylbenzoate--CoA ligase [Ectothiorhodospira lacustris]MCG5511261.1 o-succinylbenzoate--CoA ligase [Ectothiorhodospira lacustris]MCG5522989.1 o-succinylbenzoate--CoA ligase [Ectothiorhodospira lacustris]